MLLLRRVMSKGCGCLILVVAILAQAVERTVEQADLISAGFVRVMAAETFPLPIGSMDTAAIGFFLMAVQAQGLRGLLQPSCIVAGMCSMAGKAVAISHRGVLPTIVTIGVWRIMAVQAELRSLLFQGERISTVGGIMTAPAVSLADRVVDVFPQQLPGL